MGCVCCSLSTFVSIVLHALERISLCTVCALLVCCLLFTILAVLVMGIGIGFHYCEVAHAAEAMANAAKSAAGVAEEDIPGLPASKRRVIGKDQLQQPLRSINRAMKRGFAHQLERRDRADQLMPSNNNTVNDIVLGRNATYVESTSRHRARRALTFNANNSVNNTGVRNITFNAQNSVNDSLRNLTFKTRNSVSDKLSRDLTFNTQNSVNDTSARDLTFNTQNSVNDTAIFTNDSVIYEYYDYMKLNSTNETINSVSDDPSVSIDDAKLPRENCTLLNFFTRFLQL